MKIAFLTTALLGSIVLLCFFLFRDDAVVTNYPPKDGPIVAFGDSLVSGVGSGDTGGFVSLLESRINEPILNLGIPGNTTEDARKRIGEVIKKNPRIVILLIGGNDRLKQVPIETTKQNLRSIITELQKSGAITLVLGVKGNVLSDRFSEEVELIADETGSAFVPDVLDGIFGEATLMSDGVHPNQKGYERIANKVYPVLEKILE